jgi:hypothetical protein
MPRVLRILQGLVVEAERRGHQAATPPDAVLRDYRPVWSGPTNGHLEITCDGYTAAVRIREEGLAYRVATTGSYVNGQGAGRAVTSLREYEKGATGRLSIAIVSGYSEGHRLAAWADRKSWTLEDKLPELLREIEIRAAEDRHRREIAEREAIEREHAWRAAMITARERHAEHRQAAALDERVAAWRRTEEIRAYCDAAEPRHGGDIEAVAWVAWARRHADALDPLRTPPQSLPAPKNVTAEDLRPFLDGWDPYGPYRRGR